MLFYSLTPTASSSLGLRLVHDLDIEGIHMNADLLSDREHVRAVDQPLVAVRGRNLHLVVDALEDQVRDNALKRAVLRFH